MAIVVHHCNGVFWPAAELGPLDAGVSFFFVLSGFILTYVYRDALEGPGAVRRFYVARIARVWPLHLVCLVLTTALVALPEPFDARVLAANGFLVHAWIPLDRYFFSYNYVSWTISAEVFFYLVFPLLLKRVPHRPAAALLVSLGAVGVLAAVSHAAALPPWGMLHDDVSSTGLLYANPLARLAEFAVGMVCGVGFGRQRTGALPAVPAWRWTLAECGGLVVFLIGFCALNPALAYAADGRLAWTTEDGLPTVLSATHAASFLHLLSSEWLVHVGLTPVAALLITVFAHQRGALSGLLSHRYVVFAGEVSFAVYLVHQLALRALQQHALRSGMRLDSAAFVAFLLSVLLLAAALHLVIEKPARQWLVRRAG